MLAGPHLAHEATVSNRAVFGNLRKPRNRMPWLYDLYKRLLKA
jgi:hypothetical protein